MSVLEEAHTLVSTLLQLAVVTGLLDKVQEVLGEGLIGEGPGYRNCQYMAMRKTRPGMCIPAEVSDMFKNVGLTCVAV